MTVVCTDGITIAADSQTTFGDERSFRPTKKIIVENGRIFASSGVSILPALVRWHVDGADPHKLPAVSGTDGWFMLMIDRSGYYYITSAVPYPIQVDPPFAIGSAADFAIGAMDYGASPKEAVAIAIKRSISCGGEIQVVNIAEALGQLREAAE
jgi:ATP-dependent protease HslVU (ClpYQ) peptidase subunit